MDKQTVIQESNIPYVQQCDLQQIPRTKEEGEKEEEVANIDERAKVKEEAKSKEGADIEKGSKAE